MPTRPTSARPRIAVAGFQHETNTFAPTRASLVDFEKQDAWPALTAGEALYDVFPPLNIPLGGFLKAARDSMDLVPLLWASAEPSGHVEETAYEAIADSILSGIESAGKLDGIYLDLHGAMVTEHLDDGEGELLRRIRMLVGDDLPLAVSLDLHANVTEAMVEHASIMTVFRTYPHIDMAATGARACGFLYRILENQERIFKERRLLPFLLPLSAQSTDLSPAKEIYRDLIAYEAPGLLNLEFAMGFPPADLWDSGSAFLAYGNDPEETQAAADGFLKLALDLESEFHNDLLEPDEAVSTAVVESGPGRTYVLADVQDNPGAGGTAGRKRLHWAFSGTRHRPLPLMKPVAAPGLDLNWVANRDRRVLIHSFTIARSRLWGPANSPVLDPCMVGPKPSWVSWHACVSATMQAKCGLLYPASDFRLPIRHPSGTLAQSRLSRTSWSSRAPPISVPILRPWRQR
jgi:microcystin degradation protein MlrC